MSPLASHAILETWEPRRSTSLKEARRRTAFVHILRLLFTVGAVLSAGFLIGPAVQHAIFSSAPKYSAQATSVTVLKPRWEGRDANDGVYVITAETAHRRRENPSLIDLVLPTLVDQASTQVQAREGVYDRQEEILDLAGDVIMTDAGGYTFRAERSRMYVRESRVVGETPLVGEGPVGEVRADAYEVFDGGDRIVLTGNVWTKFVNTQKEDGGPAGSPRAPE
jgi:lipopolysaccharide export system protein LptC